MYLILPKQCWSRSIFLKCFSLTRGKKFFFFLMLVWYELCYKWNVCVFPKVICWNGISSVLVFGAEAFGRWLVHEVTEPSWMINSLIKQNKTKSREFLHSFHLVRTEWEEGSLQSGRGLPPQLDHAGTVISDGSLKNCEK